MSYVLHIWQEPVPSSLYEAESTRAQLARQRGGQNPRFVSLAQALTARYPSLETLDDDDEGVWSDGPLDGRGDAPVMNLGVASRHDEVVAFVVENARRLGLVVLDGQAGRLHLPDGRTLDARGPVSPAPPPAARPAGALQSKAQALGIWQQTVRPVMEAAGFKVVKANAAFKKRSPETLVQTVTDIDDLLPRRLDLRVYLSVNPIWPQAWADLARQSGAEYCGVNVPVLARACGIEPIGPPDSHAATATVASLSDLQRVAAWWERLFREAFVPLAHRCATLRGLEREFNAPDSPFLPMPIGILLAAVVDNPELPAVAQRTAASVPPWFEEKTSALVASLQAMGRLP